MLVNKVLFIWYRIVGALFRVLSIKKNKIVFSNFFGKGYGDNPKCLAEEFLKKGSFELIWLVKGDSVGDFPEGIKPIKRWTLSELYHLSTAKIWIDNSRKHYGMVKRKEQYYVQTWHANIGLKKAEADTIDKLSKDYVKSAKKDSKMIDLFLSGSKWCTDIIHKVFWYDGEVLEHGIPRSDIFYKQPDEYIKKVYEYYNLDSHIKLILYAPTFRNNGNLKCYSMDFKKLLQDAKDKWGGEWKVLVRLHPNIQEMQNVISYNENILNGSKYMDINELIIASDILITDYSSCMFDAMEAGKKVILYATDVESYMDDRGTHFTFKELPFCLAQNNEELGSIIHKFDEKLFVKKVDEFMNQCGFCNCANSSEKIVNYILEKI